MAVEDRRFYKHNGFDVIVTTRAIYNDIKANELLEGGSNTRGRFCCLDTGCNNMSELQLLEITRRDECIKELRKHGLSIRQISRLTGISKGVIEKIGR